MGNCDGDRKSANQKISSGTHVSSRVMQSCKVFSPSFSLKYNISWITPPIIRVISRVFRVQGRESSSTPFLEESWVSHWIHEGADKQCQRKVRSQHSFSSAARRITIKCLPIKYEDLGLDSQHPSSPESWLARCPSLFGNSRSTRILSPGQVPWGMKH